MTPEDLAKVAEWERLASEATEGPWSCDVVGEWCDSVRDANGNDLIEGGHQDQTDSDVYQLRAIDAAFIAAARTAVPEMARMLRGQVAKVWVGIVGDGCHDCGKDADVYVSGGALLLECPCGFTMSKGPFVFWFEPPAKE